MVDWRFGRFLPFSGFLNAARAKCGIFDVCLKRTIQQCVNSIIQTFKTQSFGIVAQAVLDRRAQHTHHRPEYSTDRTAEPMRRMVG
jgi:hypothetical protein